MRFPDDSPGRQCGVRHRPIDPVGPGPPALRGPEPALRPAGAAEQLHRPRTAAGRLRRLGRRQDQTPGTDPPRPRRAEPGAVRRARTAGPGAHPAARLRPRAQPGRAPGRPRGAGPARGRRPRLPVQPAPVCDSRAAGPGPTTPAKRTATGPTKAQGPTPRADSRSSASTTAAAWARSTSPATSSSTASWP